MNAIGPVAKSPATYQDVLDAPENMVAELIGGALTLQPRPASPHARAASVLMRHIGGPFDYDEAPGGWWILVEPELHLGDDILVPDIAGWRRDAMPAIPDAPYFTQAPDWVCEVLSPSTRRRDMIAKQPIYHVQGVGHLWLVDPIARTLQGFRSGASGWELAGWFSDEDEVALDPFDDAPFALASLWLPQAPA